MWSNIFFFQTGGYFRFIAGWHLSLTNWGSNEPQVNNPCVFVSEDGKWRTADCNQKMASICMKSTGWVHVPSQKNHFHCHHVYHVQANTSVSLVHRCATNSVKWIQRILSCTPKPRPKLSTTIHLDTIQKLLLRLSQWTGNLVISICELCNTR